MRFVGESSIEHPIFADVGDGVLALVASRCPQCGDTRLPARTLCPNDLSECDVVHLSGDGVIYEAVRISLAPRGFDSPFWVGYVDLDEGVRMFAQIEWAEADGEPSHGDRVVMDVRPIGAGDDRPYGPSFRKVSDDASS